MNPEYQDSVWMSSGSGSTWSETCPSTEHCRVDVHVTKLIEHHSLGLHYAQTLQWPIAVFLMVLVLALTWRSVAAP